MLAAQTKGSFFLEVVVNTTTHTPWPRVTALTAAASVIIATVVLAFLWPLKTSSPQHLPVSITGPAPAVTAMQDAVITNTPDTFEFVAATDRNDAVHQIKTRETYGAVVLVAPDQAPEILTAPAGSPAASGMLTVLGAQLQAQLSAAAGDAASKVTVTEVVPFADTDPNGSGMAASAFPMMMGGMLCGVLVSLAVRGFWRKSAAAVGVAVGAGLVVAAVLGPWFGYLPGKYDLTALVIGASVLATGVFIVGCHSVLGQAGIGVGAATTMLIANPISSAATPWQFLTEPFGIIGQFFVPGAAATLLRSVTYFPEASTLSGWLILASWIVLGLGLTAAGHHRKALCGNDECPEETDGQVQGGTPETGQPVSP